MDAINGVSIEKYAELCALMADTAGDESKEIAIAEANGVTGADWLAAKKGYLAKFSDPADMGKTAMAFMKLLQEAQAKLRDGKEPCTLEMYTLVHAEMAFKKDPADPSKKIDFNIVLKEHGFEYQKWLECENYWTPMVNYDENPEFKARYNPELAMKFKQLMQMEADKIHGIVR